jgi:hypothetical protein
MGFRLSCCLTVKNMSKRSFLRYILEPDSEPGRRSKDEELSLPNIVDQGNDYRCVAAKFHAESARNQPVEIPAQSVPS